MLSFMPENAFKAGEDSRDDLVQCFPSGTNKKLRYWMLGKRHAESCARYNGEHGGCECRPRCQILVFKLALPFPSCVILCKLQPLCTLILHLDNGVISSSSHQELTGNGLN